MNIQSVEGWLLIIGAISIAYLADELRKRRRSEAALRRHQAELKERCRELVRAQEAAEKKTAAAEVATQAKSMYLSTMSHEIRNPLNGIFGMTNLLLTSHLEARQLDWVKTLRRSCDSLYTIVNDVLDISKIEAGALELEGRGFNLRDTVAQVLEPLAPEAKLKGVELFSIVDLAVPRFVVGDAARLGQVLTNLVSNALKFTDEGQIHIVVNQRFERGGEMAVRFQVWDTGVGIAPEQQKKLFQPFAQADTSINRRYGGTGLGLAISRLLVERMGGCIRLESEEGVGSCFSFTIRAPVAEGVELAEEDRLELSADFARHYPLSILVAEDDEINQCVMKEILGALGYEPSFANDGAEVLAVLAARPYDLLLLDLQMPVLDGFEVAGRLKTKPPATGRPRIVALTGSATRDVREKCFALGMSGHLTKPIHWGDLMRVLKDEQVSDSTWKASVEPGMPTLEERAVDGLRKLAASSRQRLNIVPKLIETFRRLTPERLAQLRDAFHRGDIDEVERVAHQLKGSAGQLGARRLAFVSGRIEEAALAGDLHQVEGLLGCLDPLYSRTVKALAAAAAKPMVEEDEEAPVAMAS
jgi:signal transduction histidine kinase/response regulator RpfG family c-di-GMP phosphodiesterase